MPKKNDKDTFEEMVDSGAEDAKDATETPSTAMEIYTDAPEFTPDDILIPRLRLAQGLTAEVAEGTAKMGEWVIDGEQGVEEVLVVPLLFGRMRELREDPSGDLLCFSRGAEIGEGDPGGVCADCPLSKWDGRTPPECSFQYGYVVYSHTHDILTSLSLQKSAIKPGKKLNGLIHRRGLGKCVVSLKSTMRENRQGQKFYVPAIIASDTDEKILAAAAAMAAEGL